MAPFSAFSVFGSFGVFALLFFGVLVEAGVGPGVGCGGGGVERGGAEMVEGGGGGGKEMRGPETAGIPTGI